MTTKTKVVRYRYENDLRAVMKKYIKDGENVERKTEWIEEVVPLIISLLDDLGLLKMKLHGSYGLEQFSMTDFKDDEEFYGKYPILAGEKDGYCYGIWYEEYDDVFNNDSGMCLTAERFAEGSSEIDVYPGDGEWYHLNWEDESPYPLKHSYFHSFRKDIIEAFYPNVKKAAPFLKSEPALSCKFSYEPADRQEWSTDNGWLYARNLEKLDLRPLD